MVEEGLPSGCKNKFVPATTDVSPINEQGQ
jgi:hypothetical protein